MTEPKRESRVITPNRVGSADAMRQDWVATAEEGTTVADILDPSYWAHVAKDMVPMAHIEVRVDTGEWLAQLLVINRGTNWAQVHLLHEYQLVERTENQPAADRYDVKWKGPIRKFVVVRKSDSEAVQEGLPDKTAANDWITNFERAAGR